MTFQYRFTHACGHPGFGPIVSQQATPSQPSPSVSSQPAPSADTLTIPLSLPFTCPFCTPGTSPSSPSSSSLPPTPPGSGILAILNSAPIGHFLMGWTVIKPCRFEELEPGDWRPAFEGRLVDGRYRQMAWIARPCGEVRIEGLEEGREALKASDVWRDSEGVESIGYGRFAGLLSSLHKAALEREEYDRGTTEGSGNDIEHV